MRIGSREFDTEHQTYIMGILNVTPDSFSDGGKYSRIDAALEHAEEMIGEGTDIIDVGGESTRPGHVQITDEEEIARVVPVIEALKSRFDIPVSVDTYKSAVARAALQAGADLVNDIWGLKYDPQMAHVIAGSGAACCLMHNRDNTDYGHFIPEFMEDMRECLKIADKAGIARDKIILDPGVGLSDARAGASDPSGNIEEIRDRADTGPAAGRAGRGNARDYGLWSAEKMRFCTSA